MSAAPSPPRLITDVGALDEKIKLLLERGEHSERTVELACYEQHQFEKWCEPLGLASMPAQAVVVASYLAWMAVGKLDEDGAVVRAPYAMSSIRAARTGVGHAHRRHGHVSPTSDIFVSNVLRGIARQAWIRRAVQQEPLTHIELGKLLAVPRLLPTLCSVRDRAAVLLVRASRWSLADVVALTRADVRMEPTRLVLGSGSQALVVLCRCGGPMGDLLCPVAAVRELLEDLPSSSILLLGVSHAAPGGGTGLTFAAEPPVVLRAIQAAVRGAGAQPGGLAGLSDPEAAHLLGCLDPALTQRLREDAVLLCAWHLALRGGEVGSLQLADLCRDERGYTAWLGRTKTDQLGVGTPLSLLPTQNRGLDPVAALDSWLLLRGPTPGPVFAKVQSGQAASGPTTAQVSIMVRQRSAAAKLTGSFSSHSLRSGFVVSALQLGASVSEVMTVTRHRDPSMVGYYGRHELGKRGRAPWKLLRSSAVPS